MSESFNNAITILFFLLRCRFNIQDLRTSITNYGEVIVGTPEAAPIQRQLSGPPSTRHTAPVHASSHPARLTTSVQGTANTRNCRRNDLSPGFMAAMLGPSSTHTPSMGTPSVRRTQNRSLSNDELRSNIHQLREQVNSYASQNERQGGRGGPYHRSLSTDQSGRDTETSRQRDVRREWEAMPIISAVPSEATSPPRSEVSRPAVPRPTAFTVAVGSNNRRRSHPRFRGRRADENAATGPEVSRDEEHSSGGDVSMPETQQGGADSQRPMHDEPAASTSQNDNARSDESVPQASTRLERSRTFVREREESPRIQATAETTAGPGSDDERMHVDETTERDADLMQGDAEAVNADVYYDAEPGPDVARYQQAGTRVRRVLGRVRDDRAGNFTWPRGVAVSASCHIVIADSGNDRVQIFDEDGTHVSVFGSRGDRNGEFECIAGVAVTEAQDIIVSDRSNHRIQIFGWDGQFKKCFGRKGQGSSQLSDPWGVTCDRQNIYVCDKHNHRLQIYRHDGSHVRSVGKRGSRDGQFVDPCYVALFRENDLIVSDSGNDRLQVFSRHGVHKKTIGCAGSGLGQFKHPLGVAIDQNGFIIVADSGNNRVQILLSDGQFCHAFGGPGTEQGCFKNLEGVGLMPDGQIVVSDRGNHRVQIF